MVHGVEQVLGMACLRIATRREGEHLVVEVSDDAATAGRRAASRRPPTTPGQGIGLSNTKARLEKLYHGQAQLEFVQPPAGGTVVRLRVPLNLPTALPATAASPNLVPA